MQRFTSGIFFLLCFLFFIPQEIQAIEKPSFVTVVNPVRGRPMWSDMSLLGKQADSIHRRNLLATWLIQYNVLEDEDVVKRLKSYSDDELGVFLEVSEQLATDSRVPYILGDGDWARADKVLFSGYEIAERKKMIDTLFEKFKETFGQYPKSVGAWYIDAVTLEYIVKKYGVIAALDCSDQYATDGYETWGKPWGTPYYPSRWNSLIPASTQQNKLPVVKIQWALRDPRLGYGPGIPDSTYSLQPNDYVGHHDLNIDYFKKLLGFYLDTANEFSQATVGLEVGTESQFLDELDRQLEEIKERKKLGTQVMTMSQFAQWYGSTYPNLSPPHTIFGNNALWYSSNQYRVGLVFDTNRIFLRDIRIYDENYLDSDLILKDSRFRLYRSIPGSIDDVLFQNGKILAQDISNVHTAWDNNQFVVSWEGTQAGTLRFTPESGFFNTTSLFEKKGNISSSKVRSFLAASFAKLSFPQLPIPVIRYASINGKVVFGIQRDFEHITGFSFPPIKWGMSYFPFQTLIRFKTLPTINLSNLFFTSDSRKDVDQFIQDNKEKDLKTFSRSEMTGEKTKELTANFWQRVFENNEFSVWQKKVELIK